MAQTKTKEAQTTTTYKKSIAVEAGGGWNAESKRGLKHVNLKVNKENMRQLLESHDEENLYLKLYTNTQKLAPNQPDYRLVGYEDAE